MITINLFFSKNCVKYEKYLLLSSAFHSAFSHKRFFFFTIEQNPINEVEKFFVPDLIQNLMRDNMNRETFPITLIRDSPGGILTSTRNSKKLNMAGSFLSLHKTSKRAGKFEFTEKVFTRAHGSKFGSLTAVTGLYCLSRIISMWLIVCTGDRRPVKMSFRRSIRRAKKTGFFLVFTPSELRGAHFLPVIASPQTDQPFFARVEAVSAEPIKRNLCRHNAHEKVVLISIRISLDASEKGSSYLRHSLHSPA